MKRYLTLSAFLITAIVMNIFNPFSRLFASSGPTNYAKLWQQVEKAQEDDLPRQVIARSQRIFDQAVSDHEFAHMFKAWVTIIQTRANIDPDDFRLNDVPKVTCEGPVEQAIYHAIMGTACLEMKGTTGHDLDADHHATHEQQAAAHFDAVLADMPALAATSAQDYKPIVDIQDDSRLYGHDLLSLLTHFVLDHAPYDTKRKAEVTAQVSQYYRQAGKLDAALLMQLAHLDMQLSISNYYERISVQQYRDSLTDLLAEADAAHSPVAADLALAIHQHLSGLDDLDFCRAFVESHPDAFCADVMRHAIQEQMEVALRINLQDDILADQPFNAHLSYSNTATAILTVRRFNGYSDRYGHVPALTGEVVYAHTFEVGTDDKALAARQLRHPFSGEADHQLSLAPGHYVLVLSSPDCSETDVSEAKISSMRLFRFNLPGDKLLFLVRHNITGRPVPGASITLRQRHSDDAVTLACNDQGEAIIDYSDKYSAAYASLPGTQDVTPSIGLGSTHTASDPRTTTRISLYSDRAIYRPGQPVHVAGISYSQLGDDMWVNPARSLAVELRNHRGEVIGRSEVTTNRFGSFDTEFTLPAQAMPGRYVLKTVDGGQAYIQVEEYKRPTFDVEASAPSQGVAFTFGDTIPVQVKARAYSGVAVQGASVKYKVETASVEFWSWYEASWSTLQEGNLTTDADGVALTQLFLDPKALGSWSSSVVRYRVSFTVTDQAGETHSTQYDLSLSRRSFALQIDLADVVDASSPLATQLSVQAINANRNKVDASGTYHIVACQSDDIVCTGQFSANHSFALPALPSGRYKFHAAAFDSLSQQTIEAHTEFDIYDPRLAQPLGRYLTGGDRHAPDAQSLTAFSSDFFIVTQPTLNELQPVTILFSPAHADAYVGYHIVSNDKVIERHSLPLQRRLYSLDIPYRPEYGDGISIYLYYVSQGHVYEQRHSFQYERPNTNLVLGWTTFRDRLYPGQDEQWVLNITDHEGHPMPQIELLATMYDASLDALASHSFPLYVFFSRQVFNFGMASSAENHIPHLAFHQRNPYAYSAHRSYSQLTQYVHDRYLSAFGKRVFRDHMADGGMPMPMLESRAMVNHAMMVREDDAAIMELEANEDRAMSTAPAPQPQSGTPAQETFEGLRTDFSETAFFMPHLVSDDQGDVRLSFTLPESLTQWRFRALAHDTHMQHGGLSATIVARKDFMIQPNLPRFVREGDAATLTTRVINQTDAQLQGHVSLRLSDAESGQTVFTATMPFSVEANLTTAVTFQFDAPQEHPLLVCEVMGRTTASADGERHYLPVLSSQRHIVETVPFYVTPADSSLAIDLSSLFNSGSPTATQRRLTFEFTERPEWTIIQALDGIKDASSYCSPSLAAAVYANTMASRIARSIPGFEQAVRLAADDSVAVANMADDQSQLRDILLQESPWLLQDLDLTGQRQRLLQLFDADLIAQRTAQSLEHLHKLQCPDGSFAWYPGMSGSYYMTLATCETLALLAADGNDEVSRMVSNALRYLDNCELEAYDQLRREGLKLTELSESTTHYLYVCSLLPQREVSRDVRRMRDKMLDVLQHSVRSLTILGRAQAACVLRAFDRKRAADLFVESAVEYSVVRPGMGRHYLTDAAYYSWRDYRIPTQLAAMRAIQQSGRADSQQLLREMQLWLMRQKQTQTWDNPLNTISAVSFLLSTCSLQQPAASRYAFQLDGHPLAHDPSQSQRFLAPQLGYSQQVVPQEFIAQRLGQLTVTPAQPSADAAGDAEAPVISWGSVYAQCLERIDRLQAHSAGELSIHTRFIDAEGHDILPDTPLHVGDQLTLRISVTADRDMDFVQIRCPHPACLEPESQQSGYRYMGGLGGYVAWHDASTDVFFDRFRRGTVTYDLTFRVDRTGHYLSGIATAQCAYAPEFCAHSAPLSLTVGQAQ